MMYSFGFLVVLLVIIFLIWYIRRRRAGMQIHNKLVQLRDMCRPENIIKAEIRQYLVEVQYTISPDAAGPDNCAICCEEFKKNQMLTQTECKHLFHELCLWKWIETRLQHTMNVLR